MSKIYQKATVEELELLSTVISQYHSTRFGDCGMKIALTFVSKLDSEEMLVPALKFAGALAAGMATITPRKQKIHVLHDAEIHVDRYTWDELSPQARIALLDHEITHLEPSLDRKTGAFKKDDAGRQVVHTRRDDFLLTGFYEVVRRHGEAALEYNSVLRAYTRNSEEISSLASVAT
jgi:uncharacterized small protein (DUF1192 family)